MSVFEASEEDWMGNRDLGAVTRSGSVSQVECVEGDKSV